jgi:Bacterial Ig domain
MKQCILLLSALGFLIGSAAKIQAAAPANDNFIDRIALSGAVVTTSGNTVEATAEAGEPTHYFQNGGHSVWWSWMAPASGQASITTAGSSFDTILAVYTGNALNALSLVATNDDDLGVSTSRVTFNATAGTTYQIAVDGFGTFPNGATGSVTLNISAVTALPITLISTNSVWKYLDDGTDQGTAWRGTNFADGTWASGPGELGYGDLPDGRPEATVLCCSNAVSKFITYYFRRTFVATNIGTIASLTARVIRDDGVVVYVNGTESFRQNMPAGAVTSSTFALSAVGGADEFRYFSNSVSPSLLIEGTNWIAVEVHQNATASSDLSFDLELSGTRAGSNAPPTVALTSPSVSSTSAAPASFTLSANASDPDGSVARVDFYTNSTIVGTDFSAPFSFSWNNAVAGTYAIRAVAVDAFGLSGTSAPVSLMVTGNVPPFAAIASPSEGATFSAPASITLNATAGDLDGSVTNVEFYQGTTRIGQDNSSPFAFTTNGVPAGNYALRVVATDNSGARGTSAVVNVTVNPNTPPAISLTNPLNNATFTAPANITLAANATDLEAPVASVAFYSNSVQLGTDATSPFTFDWSGVATGAYALHAIATDAGGLTATSSVVTITVEAAGSVTVLTNFLINASSSGWKYLDNGSDQGTAWRARLFDDSSWSNGVAQLGYGDGDEATLVSFGPDANNKFVTTYFRKSFVVNNASTYTNLQVALLRDDGGVVYLNGTEILRSTNVPPGQGFQTLVANAPDNTVDTTNASPAPLINGTNVIAVEIHQSTLDSSDLSMDLQLVGVSVIITGSNLPPTAVINSPANNASFNPPPATIVIDAGASDPNDTVAKVEFYSNSVKIGEDASAPYSYTYSGVGNGSYALAAVAQDTFGARGTSATVNVTVTGAANQPPTVALTNPPSGTFNAPTNLLLQASASDPDGSVAKVEFFRAGVKVGEDTTAPFALDWTNALVGTFAMTAVATDNAGLTATSVPVSLTFTGAAPANFILSGDEWKYLDNGTDQGTAWREVIFDDSSWAPGASQLGYGDGDEATVLSFGPNPSQKYVTYYFRRAFIVGNPGGFTFLTIRLKRDDGAVVYLNGIEVFRSNIGPNPTYTTLASGNASDDGNLWLTNSANASLLLTGTNAVAVEIHNGTFSSSDISFDLELIGNTGAIVNNPPTVAITSPGNNATFTEPANLTLSANASDSDGTVANVAFYANGVKLGDDASAPFTFNWNNVPLGNYALTAAATDNFGATNLSAAINVFVTASTAPELASRTPAPGTVNSLTQISVQFTEPVDGVNAADLLINGAPASSVTGSNANYTFKFPQPMDGVIDIRFATGAGITDRETPPKPFDTASTNATWTYTLADNIPPTIIALDPQPGATLKSLDEIIITFSEGVSGVNASDLRINGAGASTLSGSGGGPYRFGFA